MVEYGLLACSGDYAHLPFLYSQGPLAKGGMAPQERAWPFCINKQPIEFLTDMAKAQSGQDNSLVYVPCFQVTLGVSS